MKPNGRVRNLRPKRKAPRSKPRKPELTGQVSRLFRFSCIGTIIGDVAPSGNWCKFLTV